MSAVLNAPDTLVRPVRVAFVMEQTLGSITHYRNLRERLGARHGVEPDWRPIEYAEGIGPWAVHGSLAARRAAREAMLGTPPDVLFVHTTVVALALGGIASRIPMVLSTDATARNKDGLMKRLYGIPARGRVLEAVKDRIYRRAFRRAAAFTTWCEWARESLVKDYGVPAAAVEVIPPGIDLGRFRPRPKEHLRPRLLFVGGDFERKGGAHLLAAFQARVAGRAELDIVTRDAVPPAPGVRVHHGLGPNDPRLVALFEEADAFVFPTLGDCFPIAPLEGMAAGLPVIATAVGGIPEVVVDGETGFLVPPGDEEALGRAIETLVDDADLRRAFGARGREVAEARFDIEETTARIAGLLRAVGR